MVSGYDYSSKMCSIKEKKVWSAKEVQKTVLSFKNEKNKIQGTPVGRQLKSLYLNLYFKLRYL